MISIAWKELNFQIPEEENRMYDMQPYLQKIDQVIEEVRFRIPGNLCQSIRCLIGIGRRSLEFLSTGVCTVCRHLEVSGIPEHVYTGLSGI